MLENSWTCDFLSSKGILSHNWPKSTTHSSVEVLVGKELPYWLVVSLDFPIFTFSYVYVYLIVLFYCFCFISHFLKWALIRTLWHLWRQKSIVQHWPIITLYIYYCLSVVFELSLWPRSCSCMVSYLESFLYLSNYHAKGIHVFLMLR